MRFGREGYDGQCIPGRPQANAHSAHQDPVGARRRPRSPAPLGHHWPGDAHLDTAHDANTQAGWNGMRHVLGVEE